MSLEEANFSLILKPLDFVLALCSKLIHKNKLFDLAKQYLDEQRSGTSVVGIGASKSRRYFLLDGLMIHFIHHKLPFTKRNILLV